MPTLDVSDVLLSPEFQTRFMVTRREQVVNGFGEVSTADVTIPNVGGVVCSASPNDLERLDDNDRMGRAISIVTKFRLRGPSKDGADDYKPDLITWRGNVYTVKLVDDYTEYGRGFIQAIAVSVQSVDAPPL